MLTTIAVLTKKISDTYFAETIGTQGFYKYGVGETEKKAIDRLKRELNIFVKKGFTIKNTYTKMRFFRIKINLAEDKEEK